MSKTIDLIRKKFTKDNTSSTRMSRGRMINSIDAMLQANITESGDSLAFQVSPARLNDVIAVIDVPPLSKKYNITQSNEVMTMFLAYQKEVSIW